MHLIFSQHTRIPPVTVTSSAFIRSNIHSPLILQATSDRLFEMSAYSSLLNVPTMLMGLGGISLLSLLLTGHDVHAFPLLGAASAGRRHHRHSNSRQCNMTTVEKTEDQWRETLTPEQFYVLREEGTEQPNSSELNVITKNDEAGIFVCAGCGSPLFVTSTKYESGTGWPSFYAPTDQTAVTLSTDFKLILPRTEVSCATCEGHLGHVFDDGPAPTGQRFCMNGVAMKFQSDADHPELAATVAERQASNPYRLEAWQVLPGVMINGILGGLFFQSFLARLESTGGMMQSPLDAFPLLPAVYFGFLAIRACERLKVT